MIGSNTLFHSLAEKAWYFIFFVGEECEPYFNCGGLVQIS